MKSLISILKISAITALCLQAMANDKQPNPMNLKSIEFDQTNLSLGEKEQKIRLNLKYSEKHAAEIQKLLKNTKVNGVVTLEEYVNGVKNVNPETLQLVSSNSPTKPKKENQKNSNLKFEFNDGAFVILNNIGKDYSLKGYFHPNFTSYLLKHAKRTEIGSSFDHDLKPTLKK